MCNKKGNIYMFNCFIFFLKNVMWFDANCGERTVEVVCSVLL